MTGLQPNERSHGAPRARRRWLTRLVAIPVFFVLTSGVAWAYWTATSQAGGNGASAATKVNQGATPTAVVAGRSVTVSWAATTLATGQAVSGYQVKRYDASTAAEQTILTACTGTIAGTTCTESDIPIGSWKYTVTALFAANWQSAESARSSVVTVAAPTLWLDQTYVKSNPRPTTLAGFIGGESLVYRLDDPVTGNLLVGSLAGSPTPAAVPAGGGGNGAVTVAIGTSEGPHTVYAVSSPSGDWAAFAIIFDSIAPPTPIITSGASGTTGPAGSISFTAEAGAEIDCAVDGAWVRNCTSPVSYSGLSDGPHTFEAYAYDLAFNWGPPASSTWTVDGTSPTMVTTFPAGGGRYNDTTYNAGCAPGTGEICGTAADAGSGVSTVRVAVQKVSSGLWLSGGTFSSAIPDYALATGTTTWNYALPAATLPADDTYVVYVAAWDAVGNGTTVGTASFDIDRTAPGAMPLVYGYSGMTSLPTGWFGFTPETGASTQCRQDGGAWGACYWVDWHYYSGLTNGTHTFDVYATDAAGNAGTTTSATWTVDGTAPTIDTYFPAAWNYYQNTWYDAGCGTPGIGDMCGTTSDIGSSVSTVQIAVSRLSDGYSLMGGTFSSAAQNWIMATGTTAWNYPLAAATFPADGQYQMIVRVTDAAGNVSELAIPFLIDRTAPTIGTTFPVNGGRYKDTTYNAGCGTAGVGDICGTASDARSDFNTIEISLQASTGKYLNPARTSFNSASQNWFLATGTTSWNYALAAATFPEDTYTLVAKATDTLGNFNTTTTTFVIDRTPPAAPTITSGASGTTGPAVSISFTGEAGATFECHLDALAFAPCTSPTTYSALAGGSHTFYVRATDVAGTTGTTANSTWTVDATAPTGTGFTFTTFNNGTANKLDAGDRFTLTYTEPMAPASIVASWDGSAAQNVVVQATDGGTLNDTLTIWDGATQVPLGSVSLQGDYVATGKTVTFSAAAITMAGNGFTVTLGTPGVPADLLAASISNRKVQWTLSAEAKDLAGNAATVNTYTEFDNDKDF